MAFLFWGLLTLGLSGALVFSSQLEFLVPAAAAAILMALSFLPGFESQWGLQTVLWLILSGGGFLMFRNKLKRLRSTQKPVQDAVAGRRAVVVEAIGDETTGRVRFQGTTWVAVAVEPLIVGTEVVILGQEGLVLQVEKSPEGRIQDEWKALESSSDPKEG